MKIGIDAVATVPARTGGVETYVAGLLSGLQAVNRAHEIVVFAQPGLRARCAGECPDLRWVTPDRAAPTLGAAFVAAQTWLPLACRRERVDVVHHTKNYPSLVAARRVVTVHDLFPHYLLREDPTDQPLGHALRLALMIAGARAADHVVTPSEASARELRRIARVPAERVSAIPLAPKRLAAAAPAPSGGHFLAVAKPARYKNLPRLAAAFLAARVARPLIVVGVPAWGTDRVARALAEIARASGGRLIVRGYVDEPELRALYQSARAVVCPSLIEGFGLVPLEAASLGVPSALSRIAAHVEVMGDAALYFEPSSQASIAEALRRLDADDGLCARLSAAAHARSGAFTWAATARATLAVYERLTRTRPARATR